ncbi:cupin domain-containing protein [Candidatus Thiothrix anitrata]|jgi:50S ribosomal protein L16 3-hydroxylase|uniref:Cupin domain-containing protein n=1 Tax=Candidatus Thiothrix anitrata TaxID=2823902 RepID=A0ABX7X7V7_9GAMM|nr:cupin domain-containing protein [Candidatus Thiothrix anitrata]QTR49800.1 cupin domain-containing protein [Candidatus Thiothrix anitrata]
MFGDISIEVFLRDYWQKKPLLIRNAFPDFESPITPDELAGLACETDTARIVIEKGGKHAWEVRHGAFDDADFTNLPETHWTLLVNDTDQHLAELKAVMEPFRFIPDWRIDDLMISFAVEGGSVGPHVDEYDVFLIQAQGQRRWQITTQPAKPDNFLAGLDLRIMRDFEAEQEWVVNPGDMLYLPPNVPHYGVALNECMTYSVGFRAPSQAEMLENLVENLLEDPRLKQRFNDSERECQAHPGELTASDMERLIDFVIDALPQDTQALQLWLGKYLSQPKVDNNDTLELNCLSKAELIKLINRRATFEKLPGIRFLYFINDDEICLFANGTLHRATTEQLQFIQYLCNTTIFKHNSYKTHLQDKNTLELWRDLLEAGLINIKN